jgi:membrane fusion protein, adhesin transport system
MLSISENTVHIDTEKYNSFEKVSLSRANVLFRRFLIFSFVCVFVILFLPWTQNIRAKGLVTTLTPDQRPQTIHATIAGRVEKWYVREGQLVKKGDTIVFLSETKTDYFDPNLLARTQAQVNAKESAVGSYGSKASALEDQIVAMRSELIFKKDQLTNKIQQNALKAEAERNAINAATIDLETEKLQLARTEEMYKQGLKSKTEVENKRLKLQQVQAKLIETENKYRQTLQETDNLSIQLKGADSEYQGKIAKAESDKFSTLSDRFDAQATTEKLKNQYSNYERRASFYYITAPQDCYITKATTVGIGETVKEGEPIVSIVPQRMDLAVEMYIDPIDLPLVKLGAPVRFIFDGWPAFVFSGWPQATVGTFSGNIWAIDNVANSKGQYRLIVAPDPSQPQWPIALRPGSGARGFALLKDVPVWYELWRQLNGFPPEYYTLEDMQKDKYEKKK